MGKGVCKGLWTFSCNFLLKGFDQTSYRLDFMFLGSPVNLGSCVPDVMNESTFSFVLLLPCYVLPWGTGWDVLKGRESYPLSGGASQPFRPSRMWFMGGTLRSFMKKRIGNYEQSLKSDAFWTDIHVVLRKKKHTHKMLNNMYGIICMKKWTSMYTNP